MLPDRVSNPGPLTYESGALPIALRGMHQCCNMYILCTITSSFCIVLQIYNTTLKLRLCTKSTICYYISIKKFIENAS